MTPRLWRFAFWVAVVAQVTALYWPWTVPGPPSGFGWDKVVHVCIFAAVAVTGIVSGLRPWLVVLALLVHAPLSEVIQATLLPRYGDPGDVLADVIGTLLGAGAALLGRRHRPPPPTPPAH